MKTIAAVLTSFVVFVFIYLIVMTIMTGILYIANRATETAGLMSLLHVIFTWIIVTFVASFFAMHITNRIFKSVDIKTVYVSFISIMIMLSIIFAIYALDFYINGKYNIIDIIGCTIQIIFLFIGAHFGSKYSQTERLQLSM